MKRSLLSLVLAAHVAAVGGCATANDSLEAAGQRAAMVAQIEENAREAQFATGVGELDPRILDALRSVPRHAFVPTELERFAYLDTPLPLGHGQSISQPYLIALMVQLTGVDSGDRVFETGTGAGYVAALLATLGADVYTAELVEPLARRAAEKLATLGYDRVAVKFGDGYYGWPEKGPYDVILVKEAVHHVPPPLLRQLKPGGRMVAPIGPLDGGQILTLITKDATGVAKTRPVLPVRFTPLQGASGFDLRVPVPWTGPKRARVLQIAMKATIFDCDGTLVDSEGLANEVLVAVAAEYGLTLSLREALARFRGGRMADNVAWLENRLGHSLPEDFVPKLRARTREAFRARLRPIQGAADLVRSTSGPIGVASNGPPEKIRLTLSLTGLLPFFEGRIYSSYEIGSWKPDPDLFLHAARAMGVRPEFCTVVDDSLPGIRAGVAAGMRVLAYQPEGNDPDLPPGVVSVERLSDLMPLLA